MYDGIASSYYQSLFLFKVIGFRVQTYRRKAIQNLHLKTCDTVVDLGCGTGLNFHILHEKAGPEGTIIGVDLSARMLEQARKKIKQHNWQNVELIQSDMADFSLDKSHHGVLSTMATTMSADYDTITEKASKGLSPGSGFSNFELQASSKWPEWLIKLMVKILRRYGTRYIHTKRDPYRSLRLHFSKSEIQKYYFGSVCIAVSMV